ncbi:MAG: type IV pilus assembly protein PilM [Actinomycetota bacterium]|nr:type IV pilus assembly protein PilM [Actinomycetota bacterium]
MRAAEVTYDGGRPTLQRFAQVTLPPGAVSDGEVVDTQVVSAALRRLWSEGGFSTRKVVVGVSSQRVIVRQADVTAMSEDELRSALNFEAQELIPIPVDEAVLDFHVIDPMLPAGDPSTPPNMRILLAAAQRDMVNHHLAALKGADLHAAAVDPVALAMLRVVPPGAPGSAEAVVSIGADLTCITVREGASTRFVRVLNIGGSDLTEALSRELAVNAQSAEDIKRRGANGAQVAVAQSQSALSLRMGSLVDEVRGSLDFFLAQTDTERVNRVILTGGAVQTAGLVTRLEQALGPIVSVANPLEVVAAGKTGLSETQLRQAAPYMVTPIGLALWGGAGQRPITLLPKEVLVARRQRQQTGLAAVAVGGVAALLAVGWGARVVQVTQAHHRAQSAEAAVATLQRQKATLAPVAAVFNDVQTRGQLSVTALGHDVDWVHLLNQITAVMPADITISTFAGTKPGVVVSGGAVAPSAAPSADGTITISAVAKGGQESVANWLRALATIPGLQNTWVSQSSKAGTAGGATVNFSSDASVTKAAESNRAQQITEAVK